LRQLVEIVLPVPLDQAFTYRFDTGGDAGPDSGLKVGDLVVVPFGRRSKVTGLVVGARKLEQDQREIDGVRLRDVARVLPPEYRITGDRLRLARWLASYYALPLGEVVPLFHPPRREHVFAPGTRSLRRARTPRWTLSRSP
jgi:primosomal protein N'